jgi:branched-chain amino acid transport system ATP-binding protein
MTTAAQPTPQVASTPGMSVLVVDRVSTGYDGTQVLWGVSLVLQTGESVALIGANGAGKTTLLRALAGQLRIWSGHLRFQSRDLAHVPAHERVKAGIVMVPEGRQLFPGMTVRENLLMGAYARNDRNGIEQDLERVRALFPRLQERDRQLAGHLSGGEQQMCAIGRALMARPSLLMIDELSLGLAPVVVDRLIDAIEEIHRSGVTLLLVEQDVGSALTIADRGYVLESGQVVLEGSRDMLLNDPRVQQSFMGMGEQSGKTWS